MRLVVCRSVSWAVVASALLCQFQLSAAAAAPQEAGGISNPTFAHDIAPIVFEKCAGCHRPGEAPPFSLLTYQDVKRRANQIVKVTGSKFMPPWLPSPGPDFVGARRLTDREMQTIQNWVDAGSPSGDLAQMPAAPVFSSGWQTGDPDLVLETPSYNLGSEERDVFRNFVVQVPLDSPRWVRSIELRPENPRVTHHARLGVDRSNESMRRDAEDPAPGYAGMAWGQDPDGELVMWAPGVVAQAGTPGVAWRLFPRTSLVLHTHMQPSGKREVVKFRIGIHFAKDAPAQHPVLLRVGSRDIDIPAGAKHHVVRDQYTLPIDVDLQTIFPHAHSLCHDLKVVAQRPDGSREVLISIENFDENWHDSYRYRQPVRLPRGTVVMSEFSYDNTEGNIRNRNRPPRRTVYGSNVTDEMADVYLQVCVVHGDQRAVLMEDYQQYDARSQLVGYQKSLEVYRDNPWSLEGLAAAHVALGEPRKAIAILEERMNKGPAAVFPMVSLGIVLLSSGNLARAEAQQRAAIAMDGEYGLAWFGLGKALDAQNKLEAAEQAYRRAIELAPDSLDSQLSLADLLMRRGELEQSAAICKKALVDLPDAANLYLKLGEISAKQKKYERSLEYCRKAQQLAPYTHPPKVLLAVNCCANGDIEKGVKLLTEARAESPQHPMASLILGQLARRGQKPAAAREYFDSAASLPIPDNWPASHRQRFLILLHSERLQLAEQLQDLEMARDALKKWIQCDPENARLRQVLEQLPAK